jgi:hypothetical protein
MFGEMQLAERDEPESNILQLCPLTKYLDSKSFCKAMAALGSGRARRGQVRIPLCPPNPKLVRSIITPIGHRGRG